MTESSPFLSAVALYRASTNKRLDEDIMIGDVNVDDDIIDHFKVLDVSNNVTHLTIDNEPLSIDGLSVQEGKSVHYEISTPFSENKGGFFVESLDNLLERPEHRRKIPSRFYLADENLLYPDHKNSIVDSYVSSVKLVELLSKLSDYDTGDELIFISPDRFDISIEFSSSDYKQAKLDQLDNLLSELCPVQPDHHTQRRREIFLNSLGDNVRVIPKNQRLCQIFLRLDEIIREYRIDYDLYAKNFSFKALINELEAHKSEQIKKLSAIVQDVSTKLLSIPIAYIIIAGQLESGGGMRNHIIFIGATVFVVLMLLLIGNQLLSLRHIRTDIDELENIYGERLKKENSSGSSDMRVKTNLTTAMRQLNTKYHVQKFILCAVFLITIAIYYAVYLLYEEYKI